MIASFWSWLAGNKWARDLAVFMSMVGGLIIGERIYRMNVESGVKRRMKDKQARETAKERERVIETSHQIIEEIEDAKDAAIAAPDTVPVVSSADELRREAPAIAKVILRDRR